MRMVKPGRFRLNSQLCLFHFKEDMENIESKTTAFALATATKKINEKKKTVPTTNNFDRN